MPKIQASAQTDQTAQINHRSAAARSAPRSQEPSRPRPENNATAAAYHKAQQSQQAARSAETGRGLVAHKSA